MITIVESETLNIAERQKLIQGFPCFVFLSPQESEVLAKTMHQVSFNAASLIVQQGEVVDAIYIIIEGQAEVSVLSEYKNKKTMSPVAILGAGEGIGINDSGFYSTTGLRTASVTALTEMKLLRLAVKDLHQFLEDNNLESEMYAAAEQMLRMRLIKQCLPFGKLSAERLKWLCEQVISVTVPAGTVLFKQGDQGDKCYLIGTGQVEIIAEEKDGSSHSLAILKPPTLFGEATLITREPRNATAVVIEEAVLLELSYEHLNELWEKEQNVGNMLMTLMVDRSRPLRNTAVNEYPRSTADGQTVVILKNPNSASYFKLSEEGWFIWQQMNGQQTLMEITMALASQYEVFSPNMVVALISKLARAEFIQNVSTENLVQEQESLSDKLWNRARAILEARYLFNKTDALITKSYNKGVWFLFTRVGQLLLATLTIGGFFSFFVAQTHIVNLLMILNASWLILVAMLPLTGLTVLLHELGHAYATKYFGREVHAMGIGWYWTQPVAFTDTTDMWLDTREHRIIVNAAGIYANFFVAGICSLLVLVVPSLYLQALLWLFALMTYIKGFLMLNPSQDLDGYFILMDLFERPYLRRDATAWLVKQFPKQIKQPALLLRRLPELSYWVACFVFIFFTAAITFYVQGFIFKSLGMQTPNLWVALIVPAITVVLSSLALISDIRKMD